MKHKCGYEDCFKCPYRDCIVNGTDPADPKIADWVRKPKMTEDEIKEKKKEYAKKAYAKKKAARRATA